MRIDRYRPSDQSGSRLRSELFLESYDRVPDRVERGLQSGSLTFGKRVGRQTNLQRCGNALEFLDGLPGLPLFGFWRPDYLCRRLLDATTVRLLALFFGEPPRLLPD